MQNPGKFKWKPSKSFSPNSTSRGMLSAQQEGSPSRWWIGARRSNKPPHRWDSWREFVSRVIVSCTLWSLKLNRFWICARRIWNDGRKLMGTFKKKLVIIFIRLCNLLYFWNKNISCLWLDFIWIKKKKSKLNTSLFCDKTFIRSFKR